jgi:hypothetical protein
MPARHRRTYRAIYEMSLAASFTLVLLVSFILAGNPNALRIMALPGGLAPIFIAPALIHLSSPRARGGIYTEAGSVSGHGRGRSLAPGAVRP